MNDKKLTQDRRVDWERIEPGWRAGIKSVLQLASDYEADTGTSVSHTAINKHFKKLGIPRDLTAKIQAKAKSLVSEASVSARVSTETTLTDAQIVNEIAKDVAAIQLSHRNDISKARQLVSQLFQEVDDSSPKLEGEQQPAESLTIQQRVDCTRKLTDAAKTLIMLERDVWGIDQTSAEEGKRLASITVEYI